MLVYPILLFKFANFDSSYFEDKRLVWSPLFSVEKSFQLAAAVSRGTVCRELEDSREKEKSLGLSDPGNKEKVGYRELAWLSGPR